MIEEEFDENNSADYFAIRVLFKKSEENGITNEKMMSDIPATFIRKAKSNEDSEKILETYDTEEKDVIEKFMFLPSMKYKQRQCIYCQGQAGGGKSYLLNDYVSLYKLMNPNNRVLYFTLNSAEIDTSLTLSNYKIMKMQDFCDALQKVNNNLDDIKGIAQLFENSLLVFDDVGNLKNNKKMQKTFWDFIDQGCENMRKFNVSIYIIGHSSRTGNHGTILKEEMTNYIITGNAIQTKNDRIMTAYFGWKMWQIDKLFETDDRWLEIDTKRKLVVYPNKIITLDYLFRETL